MRRCIAAQRVWVGRAARLALLGALSLGWGLAAPSPLAAQAEPRNLNFVEAPLADVIRALATALGVNVVLTGVPERRITFTTSIPVRPEDLGGVLEGILEAHDLVLVQKGPVAQVMPAANAPTTGLVRFGLQPGAPALGLVTQLVPLEAIRADEAAAALVQVAGPRARIEAVARSNSLLVTDLASNVERYLELLRRLDQRPRGEAGLSTFVVPLRYANAEDLAASLGQLFGVAVGTVRGGGLANLSLTRSLDVYRERDAAMFNLPQPAAPAPPLRADTASGALIGSTTVVPDPPTNSLLIRTAPPNFPLLQETIEALDTRPPQVLFEVTVAEISLGKGEDFGVDWSVVGDNAAVRFGSPFLPVDSLTPSEGLTVRVSLDALDVRAVLSAIASTSKVRVLSTPEILAANNREARIVVGSRVPFVASARLGDISIDRSVQYEDVGTTLTIVPTINQDDYVSVQILQEVNTLTTQLVAAALDAPVIATREASTRAVIRNGQTIVIGGLIGDALDYVERGIPYLKDIPLLGYLFKHRSETRTRSELAIFVTPYIVRSDDDAEVIRERVRGRMNLPADSTGAIRR